MGGVFPELIWMDASHPVLWPWTHSADIRQRGGGGDGGGESFQNSYRQMPSTLYRGHGYVLLRFGRVGGGGERTSL